MQQLTPADIAGFLSFSGTVIHWTGPMPATQQQAVGLCHNISRQLNARQGELDWGADRLQTRLSADDFELVMNVEWLCEAVWLEPVGASSAQLSQADMLRNVQKTLQQRPNQTDL